MLIHMQRTLALLLVLVVLGCKKKPPAEPPDAGPTAKAVADPGAIAGNGPSDAGSPVPAEDGDAGASTTITSPPLPLASDDLELVAVGKSWGSKIIWLKVLGSRVWLSGRNVDAYADGDGPLVPGPDMLKGLPYKPGVHALDVAGIHPRLYALRAKDVSSRVESPEPTVFVHRENGWSQAKPLDLISYPHAFVPWGDGVIVVDSQIHLNAGPFYNEERPGTTLLYIGPDGNVGAPNVTLDRRFLAWTAASDGATLTLLGTLGDPKRDEPFTNGLYVARGAAKDKLSVLLLAPNAQAGMEIYGSTVHELGTAAWVTPPRSVTIEETWRPTPTTVFRIADGKSQAKSPFSGDECVVQGAAFVETTLFVIRECFGSGEAPSLVRIGSDGKRERVKLPMLAKKEGGSFRVATASDKVPFRCDPRKLHVRAPADLWIETECGGGDGGGGIPAVFRRGHAQEVVTLP